MKLCYRLFHCYNSEYLCSVDIPYQNSIKIPGGSGEEAGFAIFAILVATTILDIRPDPVFTVLRPWSQVTLSVNFKNCKSSNFVEKDALVWQ